MVFIPNFTPTHGITNTCILIPQLNFSLYLKCRTFLAINPIFERVSDVFAVFIQSDLYITFYSVKQQKVMYKSDWMGNNENIRSLIKKVFSTDFKTALEFRFVAAF